MPLLDRPARTVRIYISGDHTVNHIGHGPQRQVGWVDQSGCVWDMSESAEMFAQERFGNATPLYIDIGD